MEHKASPDHTKWMYNPDPFLAQKEVETRRENAGKRKGEGYGSMEPRTVNHGAAGHEFIGAIEVNMSSALRELVEHAIRKAGIRFHLSSSLSWLTLPHTGTR